jgi:hypothetical protein
MKRFTIVTGHYGSGKTSFSVNLALKLAKQENVAVADLDIVNPYFRISDFADVFRENGIALFAPKYANSNLDVPSLNFGLQGRENTHFIVDAGGDDAGAFALGRYADVFNESEKQSSAKLNESVNGAVQPARLEMLYVVNRYRYLTRTADEAAEFLREIEIAGGIKCTGIVNNSNLGEETTADIVRQALPFGEEVAKLTGVPLIWNVADENCSVPKQFTFGLMYKDIKPAQSAAAANKTYTN